MLSRLRPAGEQLAGSGVLYLFTYITFFINILNGNNDGQERLFNECNSRAGVRNRGQHEGGGAWHLKFTLSPAPTVSDRRRINRNNIY